LIDVAEIAGGLIFGTIAFALSDAGFHIWSFLFGFLAVGCGLAAFTQLVKKLGFKPVRTLFWSLITLDFVLFGFLSWHTFSTENPRTLSPRRPAFADSKPVEVVRNENTNVQPIVVGKKIEWQPPELPEGCQFVSFVFAGGDSASPIAKEDETVNLLVTFQQDTNGAYHAIPVVGGHVSNNRFFADVTIPDAFPFGPFKLSGNKIDGHLPSAWQMNCDANAVEIVNNDFVPVYQVIYRRPNVIEIYGEFVVGNGVYVLTRQGMEGRRDFVDPAVLELKRIFKYPATSYPGQRVE